MATKLTALKVENARPKKDKKGDLVRTEISDAGKPGLYLVVQASGKKSWAIRYRRQSDRRPRKLTLPGFPTLATAHKLAQAELDKIAEGKDPAAEKRKQLAQTAEAKDDSFAGVVMRFVEEYARKKNRSWAETARILGLKPDPSDEGTLTAFSGGLVQNWGKRCIAEITKGDVIDLLDRIADDRGGIIANRTLAALRKFFNWCIKKEIMKVVSPCAGVEAPAPETSRDRVLTDDEIRWLWKATDRLGFPFGQFGKLLLLTAQRRDEVAGMTWTELNLKGRIWSIPAARAKNGRASDVPLSEEAVAIIELLPRVAGGAGFLFTVTGKTHVSGYSRAKATLDAAMTEAAQQEAIERGANPSNIAIPPWRFHDLRRTVATRLAELDVKIEVTELILNHKSGKLAGIAGIYNRYDYATGKRTALDTWARKLGSIVNPGNAGNVVQLASARA